MKPHFKALQERLKSQTDAKLIDRWNDQPNNTAKENFFAPSIFIHFGTIPWETQPQGIQHGRAEIEIICCQESYKDTHSLTPEIPGAGNAGATDRLEVFDFPQKVYQALHYFKAKDDKGRNILSTLSRISSTPDTNYDGLVVDRMVFACEVWDYSVLDAKDLADATVTNVEVKREHPIVMP